MVALCGAEVYGWGELRDDLEHWSCWDGSVLGEMSSFWNGFIVTEASDS